MTRVAAYLRVSTDDQTVANQRADLESLAQRRGWTIVQWYEETGSAARRRPVFDRMMTDAEKHRFDVLLLWKLDRFGRSLAGNMSDVARLDRAGVSTVSHGESWLDTTSGPLRGLLIAIFSYVAESERATLIERTVAGMRRARSEGIRIGRPRAPQAKLAEGRRLVAAGVPVARAAREAGLGEGTLRRALQEDARKGPSVEAADPPPEAS